MYRLTPYILAALLLGIALSPSIAGQALRASLVAPLYWGGQFYNTWPHLTVEQAQQLIENTHW